MIILTPNQRLTATVLKKYTQAQAKQNHLAWIKPAVYPLNRWLQMLWQEYCTEHFCNDNYLLSPNQELILWEEIISQSAQGKNFLKLTDLAQLARNAWQALQAWGLDTQDYRFTFSENTVAFQQWTHHYTQRLQQQAWLDSGGLLKQLLDKINQRQINLPDEIILLNFVSLSPQIKLFFDACKAQGVKIIQRQLKNTSSKSPSANRIALPNKQQELLSMLRWAKALHDKNPDANIGCIVPELETQRESIIHYCQELALSQSSYNISAGQTLAAQPIIAAALQFLHLNNEINITDISALCHSPFLGEAQTECMARLSYDALLRQQNIINCTWQYLLHSNKYTLPLHCPLLANRIENFLTLFNHHNQLNLHPIAFWLQYMLQQLTILGWPGEIALNSQEYQVAQRWLSLMQEMMTYTQILAPLTFQQALHYVQMFSAKTYFQAQSPDAPIQILGILEGAGIPFDHLWLTGFDDTAWPPAPSPNPFIPPSLQKEWQMPNASAERELIYCQQITQQFLTASTEVIFSYTQQTEYHDCLPSPLITNLTSIHLSDLNLAEWHSTVDKYFLSQQLETILDNKGPALLPDETVRGGSDIFRLQASCPFKAFAELRMAAYSLVDPQVGLRPQDRGTVVHKVLELFWKDIQHQQNLLQLSENELRAKIHYYLSQALTQYGLTQATTGSRYNQLIEQRLMKLLFDWIQVEKNRADFKVIANEVEHIIQIGVLNIKLRIDRIDELSNGKKLIIDYKTKKNCDIADWFGTRPLEPQLPLYCLLDPDNVIGIAFAQLHASRSDFAGIAETLLDIQGIKALEDVLLTEQNNWQMQIEEWRKCLLQLADDFAQGLANVDPVDSEKICRICDLQTLCRVYEHE